MNTTRLWKVTSESRYLALILFLLLPFLGGWIGFEYGSLKPKTNLVVPPPASNSSLEKSLTPVVEKYITLMHERVVCESSPCEIRWVGAMETENLGTLVYTANEYLVSYSDRSIKGPFKRITFSTLELEEKSLNETGSSTCAALYPDVLGSISIIHKEVLEHEYSRAVQEIGETNIHWSGNPYTLRELAAQNTEGQPRSVIERPEIFILYGGPQAACSDRKDVQSLNTRLLNEFQKAFSVIE